MIFVGSLDKGYFAEEVCNKFNLSFDYVQEAAHISEQVNEILSYQKQDYTIFDVEQYIDEAEDVVDGIIKICNANNSKPIIFAAGYMNNSNIIVSAANKGITYFVTAVMLSDMKDQLEKQDLFCYIHMLCLYQNRYLHNMVHQTSTNGK